MSRLLLEDDEELTLVGFSVTYSEGSGDMTAPQPMEGFSLTYSAGRGSLAGAASGDQGAIAVIS